MSVALRSTLFVGAVFVTGALIKASKKPTRLSEEETRNFTNRVRERSEKTFQEIQEDAKRRSETPSKSKTSPPESETKK